MTSFDIATFGSITLDTFIEPAEMKIFSVDTHDYFGFEIGQKIPMKTTAKHVGGGSANSAVGFAKAGLKTTCLGTIGFDDHGQYILHQLEKRGVNVSNLTIQSKAPSSSSIIMMQAGGDRTVLNERTVCDPVHTLPDTQAIYSGHLAQQEADSFFPQVIGWKQTADSKNPRIFAWNPGKTQFNKGFAAHKDVLAVTDLLILNVEEAALFTDLSAQKIPRKNSVLPVLSKPENLTDTVSEVTQIKDKFLAAGVKHLIITDGRNGSQYFSAHQSFLLPMLDPTPPVSTLGAGDSFSVGATTMLIAGESPEKMMLAGSLNASSVVQHFGAQNGLLSKAELEKQITALELL